MTTMHVFSNRHIKNEVHNVKRGNWIYLENSLSRKRWSLYFKYIGVDESKLSLTYITNEEFFNLNENRFDNVVGNPPYTKGNVKLYTRFTQKALELSDSVTFVMPVDLESNHVTLKAHNHRVKTHLKELGENVSHHFNVGYDNIHVVHLDKNIQNEVEEYANPLDSYIPIFPKRKRFSVYKGSLAIESAEHIENGLPSVDKVQRGNNLVIKNVDPNLIKIANKNRKVSSPWIVFINHTPSKGLFNCAYIENQGQPWSMCVIAIEADSEKDAISLQNWLTSNTIQKEIKAMFELKKVYTVSKEMLEMLPWYE